MPACDENIFPAVVIEVSDRRRVTSHGQAHPGHSALARNIQESSFAGIPENRKCLAIESNHHNIWIAIIVEVAEVDTHAGNKIPIIAQRDANIEGDLVKPSLALAA